MHKLHGNSGMGVGWGRGKRGEGGGGVSGTVGHRWRGTWRLLIAFTTNPDWTLWLSGQPCTVAVNNDVLFNGGLVLLDGETPRW